MRTWSFYDAATGELSTKQASGPDAWKPTPPHGFVAIEGNYHRLTHRFDLAAGEIVQEQNTEAANAIERTRATGLTRLKIEALERKQARRVRELLAASDPQLKAIDDEIAALRAQL